MWWPQQLPSTVMWSVYLYYIESHLPIVINHLFSPREEWGCCMWSHPTLSFQVWLFSIERKKQYTHKLQSSNPCKYLFNRFLSIFMFFKLALMFFCFCQLSLPLLVAVSSSLPPCPFSVGTFPAFLSSLHPSLAELLSLGDLRKKMSRIIRLMFTKKKEISINCSTGPPDHWLWHRQSQQQDWH